MAGDGGRWREMACTCMRSMVDMQVETSRVFQTRCNSLLRISSMRACTEPSQAHILTTRIPCHVAPREGRGEQGMPRGTKGGTG